MRALKIFLIVFFAYVGPSQGTTITGNQLLEACTDETAILNGFCAGYIDGVRDGLVGGTANTLLAVGSKFEDAAGLNDTVNTLLNYCIPEASTAQQQTDVVVGYLKRNPATRHNGARFLIMQAFREAFPCE